MKLLLLTAIIAAVSTSQLSGHQPHGAQSPWKVGMVYRYDVDSLTLARLQEGASSGSAFKARFIVRVLSPGRLQAKLEEPQHAQVHDHLPDNRQLPEDLKYQPVKNLDKPFEIVLDGGRVLTLSLPASFSLPHENLLKGLIGALQVDLSTHRNIHGSQDHFDKETQQGLFRKMEIDVTGDCETLYSVSPVAAEWRRELPKFASEEDPIEITKSKNYGHCHQRVAYHFGVPEGAEWTGTAKRPEDEQFIRRATVSRFLVSRQGPIYKAETTSTVHVHPHVYGKQKAEVYSNVLVNLVSLEKDSETEEWQKPEASRLIKSLLYSMTTKQVAYHDRSGSSSSSSSSSSESHEHAPHIQQQPIRVRRSVSPKLNGVNKVMLNRRDRSSSSSSSSSSESNSAYVNDEIPNINEPAYAALYMSPQPHADKKQNIMNAQKLLQDIAQQLQNPSNMPKADFLSKFNILVRVIASMSTEQLAQTSRSIEVAKSSNVIIKSQMWMIYRDAVVQAGTLPAFQQIKSWIQTKKIQGEEAAQVVSTLVNTLRYPTKEVMTQFFKLAVSSEVSQQKFLNTAALLASTRLINMGQVNNDTVHSYYPTHMYGRLARKYDSFVLDEILPHLSTELRNAIQQKEFSKAQVYIKAIGNLGHRENLKVFAPYLEGQIVIPTYLRVQMVRNLQVLAYQRDKQARAVFFSILSNTAEPYEVRVAAINNVFMAHPTTAMMQTMAQMTHDDPSVQVRAFLKSAIDSAAELRNYHHLELARTAQAVRWMLTKEKFGYQYSIKHMADYFDDEYELGLFDSFWQIGSEDHAFPKFFRYTLKNKYDGWRKRNAVEVSFSSVQRFVEYLKETALAEPTRPESNHKYPAKKISELLNIKTEEHEPLGASVFIDLANQKRFFAFDEKDLQQLPHDIKEYMTEVSKGVDKHYTKVVNQAQVSIMFPVAMGMPFIYKYKEPTVIHIQSKAKGDVKMTRENGLTGNMDKEIQFIYARNIDGNVGFMDTLSDQYASVGVVNKLQINVPVKMNIVMKEGEVKLRIAPLQPEQDTTLIHYSVWPYSASQKKDSLVTISQDKTTKVIERSRRVVSTDFKLGQKIGMLFQLQGYSYSSDFNSLGKMFPHRDLLSNIVYLFTQQDIALTHFNFRHLSKQSQNKAVNFNVVYDVLYNQKFGGELEDATEIQDVSPNSAPRREEIVKRAAAGINTAKVHIVDLSAIFEGALKADYSLTAALAQSPVDRKIQYVVYAGKNSPQGNNQMNVVGAMMRPEITTLNFLQALQKELKASMRTDIKYGQNSRIQIQGEVQRNRQFTEELQNMPRAKQCIQQISRENNYYQPACHKMIIMAHTPNQLRATVNYKNVDPQMTNITFHVYQMVKNLGFWNSDVNPLRRSAEGKIEISADASFAQGIMQWTVTSKDGYVEMRNLPVPKWSVHALALYSPFNVYERIQNYYTRHQFKPFCSVDGTSIKTFSNRTYDYTLSPSWHVVLHDDAEERGNWHSLVILARKPAEKQQQIYISYQSETGKDLEIEINPKDSQKHEVLVKTNAEKVSEGELTVYWDSVADRPLLTYYTQPDGVLVLSIEGMSHYVLYDGERSVISTNHHRNRAYGICGRMSGDDRDDYKTPKGLVDRPELFAASFALIDGNNDPRTQELQNKAKEQAYPSEHKYTSILRSDIEWENNMASSSEENWDGQTVYRSRSYLKERGPCQLQEQVQYYENHGEICITTAPLPACQSHCRGEGYKLHPAQLICRPKLDQQFRTYRDQIRQGQNPQVSGVPQLRQYKVPTACSA